MSRDSMKQASIPNPALQAFGVLIGDWRVTGVHRLIPGTTLHGTARFEWLENGAYLLWRSEIDEPGIPSGLCIIGSDDSQQQFFMLYFDERGVSRHFEVSLEGNVLKTWRNAPGFSQRSTSTISDDGNTIVAQWDLSEDDATWKKDLELTYKRVK